MTGGGVEGVALDAELRQRVAHLETRMSESDRAVAVLERRLGDHQAEVGRRFERLTVTLDRLEDSMNALTWKVAGSAFGGGGIIALLVTFLQAVGV